MALFSRQVSAKALVPVCRQLATSFGAGIPIVRCLSLVRNNTRDKHLRDILGQINARIQDGATLADAARSQSKYLPQLFIELLAAGELGGHLDDALRELAVYYEDRVALRRTIIGKLIYPTLQLMCAWFLGTFALGIIRNLSFATRNFSLSTYLAHYIAFQTTALMLLAGCVAACVVLSRAGLLKWVWGWIATKCWPLSAVTLRLAQARFFRSFALLVASGAPIVQAIQRSAATSANAYVEQDFLAAVPAVKNGRTLVEAFSASKYLSPTAREMLYVGEESGKLDEALLKVAQYQRDEAVHALNMTARVLQVAITLVVGLVIGYIVISFWSNYYGRMMDELRI